MSKKTQKVTNEPNAIESWRFKDAPSIDCQGQRYGVFGRPHPVDGGDYAPLFRTSDESVARLAAAAPDLVKAARESADALDEVAEEFGHHNVIMDVIARLRAECAKATGEAR